MNRWARIIAGPELIWLVFLTIAAVLAASNEPPTLGGNQRLETIGWFFPILGVVASFLPFRWTEQKSWWCLARIFLSGGVGVFLVTTELCTAMRYGDSRDTGVGVAWMLFISLGWCFLLLASAVGVIVLFVRRRSRPPTEANPN